MLLVADVVVGGDRGQSGDYSFSESVNFKHSKRKSHHRNTSLIPVMVRLSCDVNVVLS